jgi:integrase/recombinase XerD
LNQAASQTVRSCLNNYLKWLERNRWHWARPQIAAYQHYLAHMRGLSQQSVAVYASIIRTRYREIAQDRELIGMLFDDADAGNREWLIDEQIKRIVSAISEKTSLPIVTRSSVMPSEQAVVLDHAALSSLVDQFDLKSLVGLRDAALICLMLATGLRETEVIALTMEDLKICVGNKAALRVRAARGVRGRPVLYGNLECVLDIVQAWLDAAGITEGLVFRGFYRREIRVREKLTPRALQSIFSAYPIVSKNRMRLITPSELRRGYAFHLLETDADLYTVQIQLGIHDRSAVQQLVSGFTQSDPLRLAEILMRVSHACRVFCN